MKTIAAFLRLLTVCSIALPLAATALAQEAKPAADPVIGKRLFLAFAIRAV